MQLIFLDGKTQENASRPMAIHQWESRSFPISHSEAGVPYSSDENLPSRGGWKRDQEQYAGTIRQSISSSVGRLAKIATIAGEGYAFG